ncbi:MAG: aminotransferase class V-fold PLP-dependent enzyme [Promethearchaeota archaeon]
MFDQELISMVRSKFPRAEKDFKERKRAFLDNGTGTLVVGRAAEEEARTRVDHSANVYGIFDESRGANEVIHEGRSAIADLLNAPSPEDIISGESATSLMFSLSYAIGNGLTGEENIVATDYEHYANLSPWLELERRGLVEQVRLARIREDGALDLNHLSSLVDGKTCVVSTSAASNVLGTKTDLKSVCRLTHEAGAYFVIDAVHHIAHGPMDVQALDCDFLVFSGYKFFSPHGSFMYGRKEYLEELKPYKVKPAPVHPPDNWEWGTRDQAKFAAIKGAVDHHVWLSEQVEGKFRGKFASYRGRKKALKVALKAVEEYEKGISRSMLEGVEGVPGLHQNPHVKVYGITDPGRIDERDPTFSFEVEGVSQDEVVRRLWIDHAIALRAEDFYSRVHEVYERPRLIRASFVQYNTLEEAEDLLKALAEMRA